MSGIGERIIGVLTEYGQGALDMAPVLLVALLVFALFFGAARISKRLSRPIIGRITENSGLQRFFVTLIHVVLIGVGIFISSAIVFPGLEAGDLVGVLGLSSVAVGFAFKEIFQNFLAGIILLLNQPFKLGDEIGIDDLEGVVEDISIRATRLKTYSGELVVIPNSDLFTQPVRVFTGYEKRRVRFVTGVAYDEDLEAARNTIANAVASCDSVAETPPPEIKVLSHNSSSVDFEVLFWTQSAARDQRAARDEVATRVKSALDARDISIPFPHLHIAHLPSVDLGKSADMDARVP